MASSASYKYWQLFQLTTISYYFAFERIATFFLVNVAVFYKKPAKNESQELLLSFNFMEVALAKDVSRYVSSFSRLTILSF